MIFTQHTNLDPNWYPDSRGSNHATHDINNLTNKTEYNGTNQICVGDGTGQDIKHTSSSSFHSL